MACSGCQRRREAMQSFAVNITKSIKSSVVDLGNAARSVIGAKPLQKPEPQSACTNCSTSVTSEGWVNTCTICGAKSPAKPIPHKLQPVCECRK